MNAAIYARKSNDQRGVSEDAKSVPRQIERARAYAASQGWRVEDAHVFTDDGISGAEFEKRAGLQALLAAAKRAEFTRLVVSEQKSIGRESSETGYTIKVLARAGVEVFEYVHGRRLTPKNWLDKVTAAVLSSVDEGHREQTRERVHETMKQKAERGYVCGGRLYGYRNRDVLKGEDAHGRPLRSHVDREIIPAEAAVVRRIFELYDGGLGLKAIAKQLSREAVPPPTPYAWTDPMRRRPLRTWAPSTIRSILQREIYRGVVVWNTTRKCDDWGQQKPTKRALSERVTARREDLRIVPDALWMRVAARRADVEGKTVRFESGRISGRPPRHGTRNLLAGLATCAECGGGLVVERSKGQTTYRCFRHRTALCTNALRIPVATVNEAVLAAVEEHVFTPEAIERVIQFAERDEVRDVQAALEGERKDVANRIARLVDAVEHGVNAVSIATKLRELEKRLTVIDTELRATRPLPRLAPAVVKSRLDEWRKHLRANVTTGRAVLQRVLAGRIVFCPLADGRGYTFEAQTRFEKLFAGIAAPRPDFISTGHAGLEHLSPADTLDEDYSVLLERATRRAGAPEKGVIAVRGFEPRFHG